MSTGYDSYTRQVMGVPNQYRKGTTMITLRLPVSLKYQVQQIAESRHTTVNRLMRDLLTEMVAAASSDDAQEKPSPETPDFTPYLRRIEASVKEQSMAMMKRRRRAMESAAEMVKMLAERFGATKVTLVGSMSKPDRSIGPESDIDLLVAGLRNEDYVSAKAAAERLAKGEFTVDLIREEDLTPAALNLFFRAGVPLQ